MKILFKLGLLTSALLSVTTSAFALTTQNFISYASNDVQTVPEPSALGMLAVGIVVLALVRRKK